jgi:hypothetical protein
MNVPLAKMPDPRTLPRKGRPKIQVKFALYQAVEILDLAHRLLGKLHTAFEQAEDPKLKAVLGESFAANVKAWCNLIDTKRELQGKPRAGTLRPEMRSAGRGKSRTILLPAITQPSPSLMPSPPIDCQTVQDVDTIEPSVQRPL